MNETLDTSNTFDYKKTKVLAADIDGTLVEKGGELRPATRESLEVFHRQGTLFGVATGRPLDSRVTKWAENMGLSFQLDFAIGMNGGELWTKETDLVRRFHLLPPETVKDIITLMAPLDVNIVVYGAGYDLMLARRMDEILHRSIVRNHANARIVPVEEMYYTSTGKVEIRFEPELEAAVLKAAAEHPDPRWTVAMTSEGVFEFFDPAVSKGSTLALYCRENDIPAESVLACGDMDNDISLMKAAGYSICLDNGSDSAKEAADVITPLPVWEDGLGLYFKEQGLF